MNKTLLTSKAITLIIINSLLLLCFPNRGTSQSLYEFYKEYNLPVFNLNEKPSQNKSIAFYSGVKGVYEFTVDNKIFNQGRLIYDDNNELLNISFKNKNPNIIIKNKELILKSLRDKFGNDSLYKSEALTEYIFNDHDKIITLSIGDDYMLSSTDLSIKLKDVIKIHTEYDEFDKKTTLRPINYLRMITGQKGGNYTLSFASFKETGKYVITVGTSGDNWKFITSIQLLFSDGEVYKTELLSKREVNEKSIFELTSEAGSAYLPIEIVNKIATDNRIRMRINGKVTDEIILNDDIKIATQRLIKSTKSL